MEKKEFKLNINNEKVEVRIEAKSESTFKWLEQVLKEHLVSSKPILPTLLVTVKESWENDDPYDHEYNRYENYNKTFEGYTLEEVRSWCRDRMTKTFPNRQHKLFESEFYRCCPKSKKKEKRENAEKSWINNLDKYHFQCTADNCIGISQSDKLIMQEHNVFLNSNNNLFYLENTKMNFKIYQDGILLETIDIKDFDEEFRKNEWPALFEANVKRIEEIQAQEKEKKLKEEEKRKEEEAKKKENEERILLEVLKKKFEATT